MTDEKPPLEGMKTVPEGLPLMFDAWAGCVMWAIGNPEVREEFRKATGYDLSLLVNRSGLDAMIDAATGHQKTVLAAFCDFVTTNMWGLAE